MAADLGRRLCFSRSCLLHWRKLGMQPERYVRISTLAGYWRRNTHFLTDELKSGAASSMFASDRNLVLGLKYFSNNWSSYDRTQEDYETDSYSDEDGEAPVNRSRKTKTRKETAVHQKTSRRGWVRPSRYVFTDLKGDEEVYRWERRAPNAKMKSDWYAKQMLRLTRLNQIDQALEMFHSLKEIKIHPTVEMFNVLISALAKSGRVRRAFNLYNDMKKHGLKPTAPSYSSLFTACMASPVPLHSLQRAHKLREEITRRLSIQDLELHVITCNAAMKAFAVCGSPLTAFEIYEEMHEHGLKPDVHTYSMLLTACANDNRGSAVKSLRVMEEMKARGLKPDIFIYNLLLKVLRNVHIATPHGPRAEREPAMNVGENVESDQNGVKDAVTAPDASIGLKNHVEGTFEDVFPGVEGFLQAMAMDDVEPDIRTFDLLLQLAGSGYNVDEEYLMLMMKEFNVKADRVFLNAVIKKKALAGDLKQAKEYVDSFHDDYGVVADETTYQALAAGCVMQKEGVKLLEKMTSLGLSPTTGVYGTLIARAAKRGDYVYLTELLKRMKRGHVTPNERIVSVLDKAAAFVSQKPHKQADYKLKEQRGFRGLYLMWKRELKLQGEENVEDEHEEDDTTKYSHI